MLGTVPVHGNNIIEAVVLQSSKVKHVQKINTTLMHFFPHQRKPHHHPYLHSRIPLFHKDYRASVFLTNICAYTAL